MKLTLALTSAFAPVLLILLIAVWVGATFHYPLVIDDPFITYRYARNLVEGNGFVFNPNLRVLSTTAPLYALILSVFGWLHFDIPTAGYILSGAGFMTGALFLHGLGLRYGWYGGWLAGIFILTGPALVLTFGLETGFYLALALGALFFYARAHDSPETFQRNVSAAFVLLAWLTLTRPDGIVLTGIITTHLFFTQWRTRSPNFKATWQKLARPLLIYTLSLAPFLLAAWVWFGSPFPSTLNAKIAQAQSGLWPPFALGFLNWFGTFAANNWLVVLFALVGLWVAWRVFRPALFLAGWGALHVVAYSLLGVAFYAWYVAPFVVALFAYAAIGIEWLARALIAIRSGKSLTYRQSIFSPRQFLFLMLALGACAAFIIFFNVQQLRAAKMDQPDAKAQIYRQAADWLATNTPRDATIDALEVGLIGYYDERRTLDFVGLVDPVRVPYLRARYLSDGVRRQSADYVVAIPPDTWLLQDPWFVNAYVPVKEFREPELYTNKPLVVYRRVDAGTTFVAQTLTAEFDHGIRLDGYALPAFVRAGDRLPIVLHLRAQKPLSHDFKITLQLLGANEQIVAQSDTYFPIRLNEDNMPFRDVHSLIIPRETPAGAYQLVLAFYYAPTNDRLSVLDANGNELDDWILLTTLQINSP